MTAYTGETQDGSPSQCLECGRGWEHCHGSLIVHVDGSAECSEVVCIAAAGSHLHRTTCVDLVGGCACE